MRKLNFYKKVRDVLVIMNNRTDSSIITACKIVQPIADDRGIDVPVRNKFSNRGMARTKSPNIDRGTIYKILD